MVDILHRGVRASRDQQQARPKPHHLVQRCQHHEQPIIPQDERHFLPNWLSRATGATRQRIPAAAKKADPDSARGFPDLSFAPFRTGLRVSLASRAVVATSAFPVRSNMLSGSPFPRFLASRPRKPRCTEPL